jgi:hypothetical protein
MATGDLKKIYILPPIHKLGEYISDKHIWFVNVRECARPAKQYQYLKKKTTYNRF